MTTTLLNRHSPIPNLILRRITHIYQRQRQRQRQHSHHHHHTLPPQPLLLLNQNISIRRPFTPSQPQSRPSTTLTILTPPLVLTGLTITLWLYKCAMMILFQNKIIYMPSMPPFSRREVISDYAGLCSPVVWEEVDIVAADGVRLVGCLGRVVHDSREGGDKGVETDGVRVKENRKKRVVILYFQGNGSSTPPRLPMLSDVLKQLYLKDKTKTDTETETETEYTILALSYRGYWKSRGRASQPGIERDALAALQWVRTRFNQQPELELEPGSNLQIVLWGQSIGAGVATGLAAQDHRRMQTRQDPERPPPISSLILETPFLSIRSMLLTLYPQKWLPYRYLGPFLRNWWDSEEALRSFAAPPLLPSSSSASNASSSSSSSDRDDGDDGVSVTGPKRKDNNKMRVLIISAERDELVPVEQSDMLEGICRDVGLDVVRTRVRGALHNDATIRGEGRNAIVKFLV